MRRCRCSARAGVGADVAEVTTSLSAARMPSGSAVVGGAASGAADGCGTVVGVGMATSGAATTARSWAWPPTAMLAPMITMKLTDRTATTRTGGSDQRCSRTGCSTR